MNVAIFANDYLPLPPTPNNRALPYGCLSTLLILQICSQASKNNTNFIDFLPPNPANEGSALYSC